MTQLTVKQEDYFSGYVTTYASVTGKSGFALEQVLGFYPGALGKGFLVYQLAEPVALGDFEWKDRTAYSDGWHFDPAIQ